MPAQTRVFCLRSVSLLRKYLPLLDVPLSLLLAPAAALYALPGPADWWKLQRAMGKHRSQYVWFRKLYMIFSRLELGSV